MNTTAKIKQAAFAVIAMTSLALSANLKADQPFEPLENVKLFGVVNTTDQERQVQQLQPSASSITEQHKDGLTVLTLSQTFTNNTDNALQGYYHLPLPNPGALISYEVLTDKTEQQLEDPQQLSLEQGETIQYQVRYELNSALLVGFHQTGDTGIAEQLSQSRIAQK